MGYAPPPYVASPKVDPQLDLRGGTMHVRDRCRGAVPPLCSDQIVWLVPAWILFLT